MDAVAPTVSLPPVTAEYASQLQQTEPGLPPVQSAYRLSRATNGDTRVDSGDTSVISSAGQTIVLNHPEKTATIQLAASAAPALPGMPPTPQPGVTGAAPTPQAQNLGKGMIQGQEVQGTRYVIQPPAMPNISGTPQPPAVQAPGMPQMAGSPPAPGMLPAPGMPQVPGAPGTPSAPNAPQAPTTADVWTNTKMQLPMLTQMNGGFGQLTQVCQSVSPGEPNPAAFQIPPGYRVIVLPPPTPPAFPAV